MFPHSSCAHTEKPKQHYQQTHMDLEEPSGLLLPRAIRCKDNVFHFLLSSLDSFPEFSVYWFYYVLAFPSTAFAAT